MIRTNVDNFYISEIRYNILKCIPKIFYPYILKYSYKKTMRKNLDLKNPKTFSEKLQYIKIYEQNPLKMQLSDKLKAKERVKSLIPEIQIPKIYSCAEYFSDLDFNQCPNRFVLKTNHSCKRNILIKDKSKLLTTDYKKTKKYFDKNLKKNYSYIAGLEMQYSDIKPKIYAEEFLYNKLRLYNFELSEYEIYCFNGIPEFVSFVSTYKARDGQMRNSQCILNTDMKPADFTFPMSKINYNIPKDKIACKILEYAKILSKDFNFVRCDFMVCDDVIYFCELTFTPYSGMVLFFPDKYDLFYGNKLKLNC